MELNEVMRTTFSAREFTADPLNDEVLYGILENARFAPSGGNRQGNRVIIVRDAKTRDELANLAAPAAKRYAAQVALGENPWNVVVPTAASDADIAATPVPAMLTESFRSAPVVLVFVVDLRVVASMDQYLDRIGMISGASIYPFVWNVLLGARQAGFGGTLTTLAAAEEPRVKSLLNIPEDFALAAVVPIGKPVKQLTKLKRKPVSDIAVTERFDGAGFSVT
jgi:nitroreductase